MATSTLLQLKSDFWRHQDEHWSGTLTGGGTDRATDSTVANLASETFPTPIKGKQIRITSGASDGDLRYVARVDQTDGIMIPERIFSSTGPVSTNTYELWGNSIYGGQPLTNLFNDTLRRLKPVTHTQQTIVTNQQVYDITTLVPVAEDVRRVYLRALDPAAQAPYTERDLYADVWGEGGAGTPVVKMRIPGQTLNTAAVQLWVEHLTSFTAFSSDTSTVDAIYRDWIVWETIFAFAIKKTESSSAEASIWTRRAKRADDELDTLRPRFLANEEPIIGAWVRW